MKKINKKGFTLVELLVVLVILTVIMTIAIPSVTSSIERSKQKQKNSTIKLLESAAEIYIDRNKNTIYNDSYVSIKAIICDGIMSKEEAKDPTNEKYTIMGYYSVQDGKWVEANSYSDTAAIEISGNLDCSGY